MNDSGFGIGDITEYSISLSSERVFAEAEKRLAYLCEAARAVSLGLLSSSGRSDIFEAVFSGEGLENPMEKNFSEVGAKPVLDAANGDESDFLRESLCLFDRFYICRQVSRFGGKKYGEDELIRVLSDAEGQNAPVSDEIKISFIRGKQANAAFEAFARCIFGVMPSGCESFADVCESVFSGETDFGIVPVESSSDGRLGSFYGMIEKYGLYIVLLCGIPMQDGENITKFALCARSIMKINAAGRRIFHFRLTLDLPDAITSVLAAGKYYGLSLCRADLIPVSSAGRENAFEFVFCTDGADLAGFTCFLKLTYPQFLPVGMYTELAAGEEP